MITHIKNTINPDTAIGQASPSFFERHYSGRDGRPTHTHDEAYLIFLLEGTVEETRQRQTERRTPSMLTVLPAGEPHATCFQGRVRTLEIAVPPSWLTRFGNSTPLLEKYENFEKGQLIWLATRLHREFRRQDDATVLMLEGILLELLGIMVRDKRVRADNSIPKWLLQVRDFLHSHNTDPLTLETIAAVAEVHPSHLTRAFRQHFGCTLGEYIRAQRIEYAKALLATSGETVAQVAARAGFADQSHFCRLFKSHMGMTPSEYQKSEYQKNV